MDYSSYATEYPTTPAVDPVFMTAYWGFIIVLTAILLIAMWKIFTKAGKPGWASIIPIYNAIVLLQIVGYSGWLIILFLIPIVNIIFSIMVYHRLSQAFGHGVGFTLGLLFLNPIFLMVLAFGKSTYTQPKSGTPASPAAPAAKPAAAPAPAAAPVVKEEAPKQ